MIAWQQFWTRQHRFGMKQEGYIIIKSYK